MTKVEWAGRPVEVDCDESEADEAYSTLDRVEFGVWLGAVSEIGHKKAMRIAKEYGNSLS